MVSSPNNSQVRSFRLLGLLHSEPKPAFAYNHLDRRSFQEIRHQSHTFWLFLIDFEYSEVRAAGEWLEKVEHVLDVLRCQLHVHVKLKVFTLNVCFSDQATTALNIELGRE